MLIHENILKKLNHNFFYYGSPLDVDSDLNSYIGYLYIATDAIAVRFDYKNNVLIRVAVFNNFKMDNNPLYYVAYTENTIVNLLNKVIVNLKGNIKRNINEFNLPTNDGVGITTGGNEDVEPKNLPTYDIPDDLKLDVFKQLELYTMQVAYGASNALLVTGLGGLGKTTTVEESLATIGKKYVEIGGDISDAGLYEKLFLHRRDLILFDDCDAVFQTSASLNILKKVLDTKPRRKVSRAMKGYFQSFGMLDNDIERMYNDTGRLPNEFVFVGQIIFISNLTKSEIANKDAALLTRVLHVDIMLDKDEIIERMSGLIGRMMPSVKMDVKMDAFNFLLYLYENYILTDDLNMRTLVHFINIRSVNDMPITIDGKSYKAWQVLCKNTYTVKKRKQAIPSDGTYKVKLTNIK